jgi:hypothetical protein
MYQVLLNGKPLGIVESNYLFASRYWAGRCCDGARFTLKPTER